MIHYPAHKLSAPGPRPVPRSQHSGSPGEFETAAGCDRPRSARRGLGDVIASVAQPIAKTLDRLFGTDIEHCAACAGRKAKLNRKKSRV